MNNRELILFGIFVFISFTALTLIFVISVKAKNEEQPSENKPSAYIKCVKYSKVLGGEVCSEFEIYKDKE